jgi:hypothetical protein
LQTQSVFATDPAGEAENAGQFSKNVSPELDLNVLTGVFSHKFSVLTNPMLHRQSDASSLERGAFEFGVQASHTEAADAPTTVENVPDLQLSHCASPAKVLNFPASQCTQMLPLEPVAPELQVHLVRRALAAGECDFSGHNLHSLATSPTTVEYSPAKQWLHGMSPLATLYLPAVHCTQAPPSGPVDPGLHLQSVSLLLACREREFDVQGWQVCAAEAAENTEYVPSRQLIHRDAPVAILYFPALHAVHVCPFSPA